MTQNMKKQSGSLEPISPSVSAFTEFGYPPTMTSTLSNVPIHEFSTPSVGPIGAIDIDDLVAEFEQSIEGAQALALGRQWVADTFYEATPLSIAKLRLQKGWSQAELASRALTSQSYIARLEQGKVDPQVSTVKKIAGALNVPIELVIQAIPSE